MPQHCNAVPGLQRVLFCVLLLSLLLDRVCFESLGVPQEQQASVSRVANKAAANVQQDIPLANPLLPASPIPVAPPPTAASTASASSRLSATEGLSPEPPASSPGVAGGATATSATPLRARRYPAAAAHHTGQQPTVPAATAAPLTAADAGHKDAGKAATPLSARVVPPPARPIQTRTEAESTHVPVGKETPQVPQAADAGTSTVDLATTASPAPRKASTAAQLSTATADRQPAVAESVAEKLSRKPAPSVGNKLLDQAAGPVEPAARRPEPSPGPRNSGAESREHLKRALCRKYYKHVLGVHSSYNIDALDCEYRPEPGSYIAEKVEEIPVQKDAAQARLDRIEAIKKLQRDAEANPTDRIIVEWDTGCLKQLPNLLQDYHTEETDTEIPVFDAYELHDTSEQVVLKRGVYLRDRIGHKEKADPEVRQVLKGREYALGVIASSLRLQVSRKTLAVGGVAARAAALTGKPHASVASAARGATRLHPCESDCKRALQGVMLDAEIPTIQAAHYSKLGVDVLHIKNLKRKKKEWNIVRASEIPALITRLVRENSSASVASTVSPLYGFAASSVAEPLAKVSGSHLRNKEVERAELVVGCILKVSDDQKREVQSFRVPSTPPVAEPSSAGDPEQPRQWHLHSFLGNYTLWADRAWPELAGKPGNPIADNMIVAVLDTGCFIHQDFIDGFDIENSRFWVNKDETDCENHIDDDGNGYVDDCFGWDFVGDQAYPFVDDLGHGTSVTSVLAARHGDALGGRGIIATGKVMCLRVGGREGIWLSDTIPALDYALRMGAKVSNHSYGGKGFDQAEFSAFRRASQADHLAVTAAGNSGCDIDRDESCLFTPGAFDLDGILNVGANDVAGYRTSFSNYGKKGVDVYAPGKSIFVGTNKAPNNGGKTCKHCYEFIDGTSFAAPMVSGMAAALWTHFEITQPIGWVASTQKKSLRVKEAIMYSVTGSRGVAGAGRVNGVVNFYKALHYYDTIPPAYSPEFPDPPNGYQPQGSSSLRSSLNVFLVIPVLGLTIYRAF